MKKLIIGIFTLLSISMSSRAAHIVGGKFSFQKIDYTTLKIMFEFERDCGPNGGASFESGIRVDIYSKTTNLLVSVRNLTRKSVKPAPSLINCDGISRCLEIAYYEDFFDPSILPLDSNGYYVNWERCCLPDQPKNIQDPGATPYSAYAEIPSFIRDPTVKKYSSPVQERVLNPTICANFEFNYYLNYTDPDGDSIAYRLIKPLSGGYTSMSAPGPNSGPKPYDEVLYSILYNYQQFIDSDSLPKLDPRTGLLSFKPLSIGVYVVGYAIDEFRNNKLIGTTYHQTNFISNFCSSTIINQPQSQTVKPNSNVIFKAKSSDSAALYQWAVDSNSGNFIDLIGETNQVLTVNNVNVGMDSYAFKCRITKGTCVLETVPAKLRIEGVNSIISNKYESIKIFPNPSSDYISIDGLNIKNVNIYTLEGKLLMNTTQTTSINISSFETGIYLVKAEDQAGRTYYVKMLKMGK